MTPLLISLPFNVTYFFFFCRAGGKAFGLLKEQQRQKLEEINQVGMFSFVSPAARHWQWSGEEGGGVTEEYT